MSNESGDDEREVRANEPHIRQQPDRLSLGAVLLAAAVVLLISLGGLLWVLGVMAVGRPVRTAAAAPGVGPPAVSGVRQTMIGTDTSAALLAVQQRKQLTTTGWTDSVRGIARIPIEQAMRIVAEGGR